LGRLLGDLRQPSKSAIHAVLDRHGLVIFAAEIWLASYSPEHPRLFGSSEIGELDRLFAADLRAQALTPMINVPRAFFQSRTSRQPIYHIALEEKRTGRMPASRLCRSRAIPACSGNAPRRSQACRRLEDFELV